MLHERSYSVSVKLPSINEVFPGLQQLHQDGEKAHAVQELPETHAGHVA